MKNRSETKNNRIWLFLTAVFLCCIAVFLLMQQKEPDKGYRTVSVIEVSGRVGVVRDGVEYSAYPGMKLQEGYELVTGGDSYARLLLDDDKYVKLESGSKLVFETLGLLGSGKTRLSLERGALTTELVSPLEKDEEYVVNTPNAILAVRGTYFRIELNMQENGDVDAAVLTYGGQVASRRIMPDGSVIDEEVLVDAGYKTRINKNSKETVYIIEGQVVEETASAKTDKTERINKEDISDEDLIDIYFSAENGHALFMTADEAKEDILSRDIVPEDQTSVYEKAEQFRQLQNGENGSDREDMPADRVVADDSQPLVRVEETENDGKETIASQTGASGVAGPMTDGTGTGADDNEKDSDEAAGDDKESVGEQNSEDVGEAGGEDNEENGEDSSEVSEDNNGESNEDSNEDSNVEDTVTEDDTDEEEPIPHEHMPVLSGTVEPTCTEDGAEKYVCECGYSYVTALASYGHNYVETVKKQASCMEAGIMICRCDCGSSYERAIAKLTHITVSGGVENCHSKCNLCGEVLSTVHEYRENVINEATCEEAGLTDHICVCGYSYEEEIPATGHTEENGGEEDVHMKCGVCGQVLADGPSHRFTDETFPADCVTSGKTVYTCDCGYYYEKEISATGHTEEKGGGAGIHSKCSVCGETLADESAHSYSDETFAADCINAGKIIYTCSCGYEYEETIPATGHTEEKGGEAGTHSKCSVCGETLAGETAHSYEVETTPADCETTGKKVYTCGCGYTYEEVIPATGHDYAITTLPASCTENGLKTYECECGEGYDEVLYATGHIKADENASETTCSGCGAQLVVIDAVNFPDEKFRTYVIQFDSDGDGYLLASEMAAVTAINVSGTQWEDGGYSDLTGIGYFAEITTLACGYNSGLTSLDLSQNTKIAQMDISNTGIVSAADIIMSQTAAVTELTINNTDIEFMAGENFSWMGTLTALNASYAGLSDDDWTAISMAIPSTVQNLNLAGNDISTLDMSGNTSLVSVNLTECASLTTMTLAGCTALTTLDVTSCTSLTSLDVSGCTMLQNIDEAIISCTSLAAVDAGDSGLLSLSVSSGNGLQSLDISNTPMQTLSLQGGNLSALTLEGLRNLTEVSLDNVPIQSLTIENCSISTYLSVAYCDMLEDVTTTLTPITATVFTGCTRLQTIYMDGTGMTNFEYDSCAYLQELTLNGSLITSFTLNGSYYTAVTSLNFVDCSELAALNLNSCASLTNLNVSACTSLTSLDLSSCTMLTGVSTGGRYADGTLQITGLTDESIIMD